MSSSQVATKPQGSQQVSHQPHDGYEVQSKESSANASASAGLNLNVFGAVSGMFSSKSKKDTAADGSSVEHRDERAAVKGAGAGNMSAVGAAQGQARNAEFSHIPIGGDDTGKLEGGKERKKVQSSK